MGALLDQGFEAEDVESEIRIIYQYTIHFSIGKYGIFLFVNICN